MLGARSLEFASLALQTPAELGPALVRIDVLSHAPHVFPEDLAGALTLRDALLRCFTAIATHCDAAERDVETLNSFAADEPPMVKLAGGRTLLRLATDPVRCALAALARDGIEVIALRAVALRRCVACATLFLDESRGGRRRWCAMARCGNRAKVAGYRARRHR